MGSVGSDDAKSPYTPYFNVLSEDSPGYFQTYTTNSHPASLVRFLDEALFEPAKPIIEDSNPIEDIFGDDNNPFADAFKDFGQSPSDNKREVLPQATEDDEDLFEYIPPPGRAQGRPHNLGWLKDLMKLYKNDEKLGLLDEVPPGEIITK